jgi:hypothetical protein
VYGEISWPVIFFLSKKKKIKNSGHATQPHDYKATIRLYNKLVSLFFFFFFVARFIPDYGSAHSY